MEVDPLFVAACVLAVIGIMYRLSSSTRCDYSESQILVVHPKYNPTPQVTTLTFPLTTTPTAEQYVEDATYKRGINYAYLLEYNGAPGFPVYMTFSEDTFFYQTFVDKSNKPGKITYKIYRSNISPNKIKIRMFNPQNTTQSMYVGFLNGKMVPVDDDKFLTIQEQGKSDQIIALFESRFRVMPK